MFVDLLVSLCISVAYDCVVGIDGRSHPLPKTAPTIKTDAHVLIQ